LKSGSFISARRDAPRCERQANGRGVRFLLADAAYRDAHAESAG